MPRLNPHLKLLSVLWMTLCFFPSTAISQAQDNPETGRRIALVIGNSDYPSKTLSTTKHDAQALATKLSGLGFQVRLEHNLDRQAMQQALETYRRNIARGGVGLFYYSGYAIQTRGRNYLIPVDANIRTEPDIDLESVDLSRLTTGLDAVSAQANIIVLDAARYSPYEKMFRSGGGEGLAFVTAAGGTFVAYAHSPGKPTSVADPPQGNSVYTATLLKHIDTPGLEIGQLFGAVRAEVRQTTQSQQLPWESHRLGTPFRFVSAIDTTTVSNTNTAAIKPQDGQMRTINGQINMVPGNWVLIKSGSFLMGSPSSEPSRSQTERQYKVTLTRSFLMQKTEVTQTDWFELMGNNPSQFSTCKDCPVERVNLYDALSFANALSKREGLETCYAMTSCTGVPGSGCSSSSGCTGSFFCGQVHFKGLDCKGYRLPTEAEWEYAARAGNRGMVYGTIEESSWYANNSVGSTHPVGQKLPNAWGLHDMLGNVWEWVWGWHSTYPKGPTIDPLGSPTTTTRVNRGAGWRNHRRHVRFAMRHAFNGKDRYNSFGFRLVRTWSP